MKGHPKPKFDSVLTTLVAVAVMGLAAALVFSVNASGIRGDQAKANVESGIKQPALPLSPASQKKP